MRLELRSDVVGASTIALLCLTAGLLLLSLVFYLGILQRALCPYSEAWGTLSSLEKMANAGEKLRGSLVDGMGRGGVLRQIAATIERTASHTGSILSLHGSFSKKPTTSASQQNAQPADVAGTSDTQPVVKTDNDKDSWDKSEPAARRRDRRVTLAGPPVGTKHRRNASDGSDGGGENAPLSVYSKELHRWVAADASHQITVDRKGTPHKRRVSKTPTNTTPTATISATDSVKRRLKFLRPSPTASRATDKVVHDTLSDRAKTGDPDQLPRVVFQDQLGNSSLGAFPCKLDITAEVHEEDSLGREVASGSPGVSPAVVSDELNTSGGFGGLALHGLPTGLELQLDMSTASLGATSPHDLPTPMGHDATHNRFESVESASNDCGVEREEDANSRRRRRRAQSFVSASRRPRKLSVVGRLDTSAIVGTPAVTATPRATPRPSHAPENCNSVLATATPELAIEPGSESSVGCSVACETDVDPDATWSHRKQLAYLCSEPDLLDFGPELPTPIPSTASASGSVDLQPEPELGSVSASSEDECDAALPPGPSPTPWPARGVKGSPASVLKRRKVRSTSLETSVVVGGGNSSSILRGGLNASALSDGTFCASHLCFVNHPRR